MREYFLIESSGFATNVANALETEFAAEIRKQGIAFVKQPLPERRDQFGWTGIPAQLVITIVGSAVGGTLATYAVKMIDSFLAKTHQREHLPQLEIKVIYDSRRERKFQIPRDSDAARRYLTASGEESHD